MNPNVRTVACMALVTVCPTAVCAQDVPGNSPVDLWERTVDPSLVIVRREVTAAEDILRAAGRMAREAMLLGDPAPSLEPMFRLALERYLRALALAPDDVPVLAAAASLAERLGDHTNADSMIDHALALRPEGPDAPSLWFDRALVHTRQERFTDARDDYLHELAFPLDPIERAVVLGNLADTYISLGDLPRAEDTYARCVTDAPGYALGWLGLAVTYDKDGRAEANESVQRALQAADGRLLDELDSPSVFFIPPYDRYYYSGMAWEAMALSMAQSLDPTDFVGARRVALARESALASWQTYLRAAPARDPWRARVRAHITALDHPSVPVPVPGSHRP